MIRGILWKKLHTYRDIETLLPDVAIGKLTNTSHAAACRMKNQCSSTTFSCVCNYRYNNCSVIDCK